MQSAARKSRGYTLLELLAATTVLAIVAGIGAPALAGLQARSAIRAAAAELQLALHRTRSAALTRGQPATVCPSADGRHCDRSGTRYLAFLDSSSPGRRDPEEPLLSDHRLPGRLRLVGTRNHATWYAEARAGLTITFTVCDPANRAPPRQLVVSATGRIRAVSPALTSTGSPAACR
jgi:type IV fimbrial biogenesis protein FimT